MQVNPMQLIQMIRNGQNPQQLMLSILQSQMGNNPMGAMLMSLVQANDKEGLEKFARNFCQSQGADFDKEFSAFKRSMGLE